MFLQPHFHGDRFITMTTICSRTGRNRVNLSSKKWNFSWKIILHHGILTSKSFVNERDKGCPVNEGWSYLDFLNVSKYLLALISSCLNKVIKVQLEICVFMFTKI